MPCLQYVLAIGNYLNAESAARGGAFGYKLDTLKKLATVKGADNKTTLLDYLARVACEEGKVRGLHRLATDLAPVSGCRTESLEAVRARSGTYHAQAAALQLGSAPSLSLRLCACERSSCRSSAT